MNFGIGSYTTRKGAPAHVRFILQEPHRTDYVLVGEILDKGNWISCTWTREGKRFCNAVEGCDLMPARDYRYYVLTNSSVGQQYTSLDLLASGDRYLRVERLSDGSYDWKNAIIVVER